MASSEEIISRLTDQWLKTNKTSTSPVEFIAEGCTANDKENHIIVGLNREPTTEEASETLTEIDGERIEYLIFNDEGLPAVWTPPKAAP